MTQSISLEVHLEPGHCGHKLVRKGRKPKSAKTTREPRIKRLMALAIKYEQLTETGAICSHQELAFLAGADRSQISRIMRLRLLAPKIQETLLNLPEAPKGQDPILWRHINPLTRIDCWNEQQQRFEKLLPTDQKQSG